ncbi:hypothetical protein FACS1894111_01720 [Clostridia bacterium]|nr:hypothetical protein FACS1894111_01720 [Clostridia bacterium]
MYGFESRVRYSEADQKGKMTINSILEYFQDVGSFQADDLGVGKDFILAKEIAWVVISWQVTVERYPLYSQKITVHTWPHAFRSFYGDRSFMITDENGQRMAYATSIWAQIDLKTGKPKRILPEFQTAYRMEEPVMAEGESRKIIIPKELVQQEAFAVQKYQLDMNQHMNNGQYIRVAQEFLPEGFRIDNIRVEYKQSAVYGDSIYPAVATYSEEITEGNEAGKKSRTVLVVLGDQEGKPYSVIEFKEQP